MHYSEPAVIRVHHPKSATVRMHGSKSADSLLPAEPAASSVHSTESAPGILSAESSATWVHNRRHAVPTMHRNGCERVGSALPGKSVLYADAAHHSSNAADHASRKWIRERGTARIHGAATSANIYSANSTDTGSDTVYPANASTVVHRAVPAEPTAAFLREPDSGALPAKSAPDVLSAKSAPDVLSAESAPDVLSAESTSDVLSAKSASDVLSAESASDVLSTESASDVLSTAEPGATLH
jgi:hypothetical protein